MRSQDLFFLPIVEFFWADPSTAKPPSPASIAGAGASKENILQKVL
jgi:hypothetical protein